MSLQPLQMPCIGTDYCLVLMPCRTLRLHQNSTTTTIATPTTNTAWQTRWTTFEAPFKTPIKLLSCCSSQGMGWHSTVPDSVPTATANCLTPSTTAAWLPCFLRKRRTVFVWLCFTVGNVHRLPCTFIQHKTMYDAWFQLLSHCHIAFL